MVDRQDKFQKHNPYAIKRSWCKRVIQRCDCQPNNITDRENDCEPALPL
jgi:hypothetical protein